MQSSRIIGAVASAFHNFLARKIIRVSVAMAIAVPTLLLTASPASATGSTFICEAFGHYCVGAPSLALFDPVVETTGGRDIFVLSLGGTSYLLEFNADRSKCVAGANNGVDVTIHPCDGGVGIVWKTHLGNDGASCLFESQKFSGLYLSGANNGTQFKIKSKGLTGWLQQFDTSSSVISGCG